MGKINGITVGTVTGSLGWQGGDSFVVVMGSVVSGGGALQRVGKLMLRQKKGGSTATVRQQSDRSENVSLRFRPLMETGSWR